MLRRRRDERDRLADEELVRLVVAGDERAFETLYDRHERAVFGLAYRLLGDREEAADLAQEAFLAVWRAPDRYVSHRGSVRGWLLAIVHHRGIDRLRQRGAGARRQEALAAMADREPAPDTADAVIAGAEGREVRSALRGLPPEQLEVLQLAYYGGFTHPEIAELLALPLGTVKGRMRLGLERLRRALAGVEATP